VVGIKRNNRRDNRSLKRVSRMKGGSLYKEFRKGR